ncbi:wd-40 repeat-containing protein [Stylonychia lemnae]|uniref:Wd-40 repeat-containing protein n=1 Tax=Stylonychia lemnae TaxID=5949 RepID=A0A078B173_STYLE|nr:wd-40 repeat-containing protein [Stylonychia lemnae]|eukprot:CDW88304.1 wd-40 repeat-containing protein [Stylonychia lemnae]
MGCYNTKLQKTGLTSSAYKYGIDTYLDQNLNSQYSENQESDKSIQSLNGGTRASTAISLSTVDVKSKRSIFKLQKVRELITLPNGHQNQVKQILKMDQNRLLSIGNDCQIIIWDMITMTKLYALDTKQSVYLACVIPNRLLIGILGQNRDKLYAWNIQGQFKSNATELVDSLKLNRMVKSLINLEFTNNRFFCVGYQTGELSIFDNTNMEIAEEVQFFQHPLDILVESKENIKLKSCIIGASRKSQTIRLVSYRNNTETIVDVGQIKVRSNVCNLHELRDLNIAVALQNGDVEIWNILKSNAPQRTLKSFDNIITKVVSLELGQILMGVTKDARFMFWKIFNGQPILQSDYPVHTKKVTGVIVHGDKIFTSSHDSSIRATSLIYKY